MFIFINIWLQNLISYDKFYYIIKLSKYLTRTKSYYVYFAILLYCNTTKFLRMIMVFYLGRGINTLIKNQVKQNRPYNDYPKLIKYFKKQKKSYSFPSQSVQSIYIIYYNYKNLCNNYIIDAYFTFILLLLIITRLYRGLHYCHDMLFSIIFADYLCKFIII